MAVMLTDIEREIIACDDCVTFNSKRRPWKGRLAKGQDPIVWLIHNGNSLMGQDFEPIPMHIEVVACRLHEAALIERGGWNGTGVRQ